MKALLVIDLQKQFKGEGYDKCLEYIREHREDYDMVIATLFENNRRVNGNFVKKLKWRGCRDVSFGNLEFKADQIYPKYGYGLHRDVFSKTDKVDVIGCETDACVLATCFNLWDDGVDFNVLWDYVYTSADIDEDELRKIYRRNFGI